MAYSASDLARSLPTRTLTCEEVQAELSRPADSIDERQELVRFLWHFVADQDIRDRDPTCAEWQESEPAAI
jgi:hypothetical protein